MKGVLRFRCGLALGALSLLGGCEASIVPMSIEAVSLPTIRTDLEPISDPAPEWTLAQNVEVDPHMGPGAKLEAGTTWHQIGRIAQGDVYRSGRLRFRITNFWAADLVMKADVAVGFYLKGWSEEHGYFTPADPEVQIKRVAPPPPEGNSN